MSKTYLIVGGASAVSLAVGAVGGYFFAKKKFEAATEERVAYEVAATKKHYSLIMMNQEYGKGETLSEALSDIRDEDGVLKRHLYESDKHYQNRLDTDDVQMTDDAEITETDERAIQKGRKILGDATNALTNYQGYSQKPPLEEVVRNNIFSSTASPKKALPPKDPETGRFVKKQQPDDPYLITQEHFLGSTDADGRDFSDYDQENLLYFVRDQTLLLVADSESVDIGRVGEVNLTLFPQVPKDEPSIICVRNEGLQIDYEILLHHGSLTEYMGLGESDDDDLPYDQLDMDDSENRFH